MTVAIVEFCWKTSVAFNSDPQKEINFRQTSPVLQRRNIRRFTSVNRRRSRKSLCAEIGKAHALKKYDQFTLNNSFFFFFAVL